MPVLSDQRTLPLTVDNTGFLLDKLGEDCHPLQFLRELTQNAIEAIRRTPAKNGEIRWDVDWLPYELGEQQAFKLCIVDNGIGMTGAEMVKYINQLSSSVATQSSEGNYGVGAKISAATRNHAGLIYLSWKDGEGAMIHLWRDPESRQYGLRQIKRPDNSFDHFAEIDDDIKPEIINGHGTKIILYGNVDDQDTMKAPPEAASPSRWIAKYLNSRYFRFPDGVTIRAREGWEQPRENTDVNVLRKLMGQKAYLDQHEKCHGKVKLTDATAHWWILKDEKALSQNSGFIESSGHVAALYQDELYELAPGRAGHAKLQQFGVIFGQRQVVVYVEPKPAEGGRLTTNTARTQLLMNAEPLPWTDWATEFRESMPDEVDELMQEIAAKASGGDHSRSIRDRLKDIMDLYKVSRYKPNPSGILRIDDPQPQTGGQQVSHPVGGSKSATTRATSSKKNGAVGGVYSAFLKKDGQPGTHVKPDLFPSVRWVSVEDGTREKGDIEDKAARYLKDQNVLLINSDFRAFTDMVEYWADRYVREHGELAGLKERVTNSVHAWYEQALTETIIGLQAMKGSPEWSVQTLDDAFSEEALTAVVMQRYHPYVAIKRELGTAIGRLSK